MQIEEVEIALHRAICLYELQSFGKGKINLSQQSS